VGLRVDIAEFFYLGMGLRVYACERAREIVGAPTPREPFNSHNLVCVCVRVRESVRL